MGLIHWESTCSSVWVLIKSFWRVIVYVSFKFIINASNHNLFCRWVRDYVVPNWVSFWQVWSRYFLSLASYWIVVEMYDFFFDLSALIDTISFKFINTATDLKDITWYTQYRHSVGKKEKISFSIITRNINFPVIVLDCDIAFSFCL